MAIATRQAAETVYVDRFCDGIIGPSCRDARPGPRRRSHRREHRSRLLGADDHAGHQGRPRGDPAGRRRRRAGRRRDRAPDPLHRRHLDRHRVGQRPDAGGPVQRRPVLRQGLPGLRRPRGRPSSRASAPIASAAPSAARGARRSRSPTATRSRWTPRRGRRDGRRGARRNSRTTPPRAGRAGALDPEPDRPVHAARPRRSGGADAPVHGPARDDPGGRPARLPQRRRLRRLPARSAPRPRCHAGAARAAADGHMDIDAVRAGAILVCPVKIAGGGVYLGDMHAMQGDGEIAGHTADVSGTVTLQVDVVKRLAIDGPVLFPVAEDLPYLARPLSDTERARAEEVAARDGVTLEETLPVSVVGTGPDLNAAVQNGLVRAGALLDMSVPEVMNRATITGAIEIGRAPASSRSRSGRRPRSSTPAGWAPRARAVRSGAVGLSRPRTAPARPRRRRPPARSQPPTTRPSTLDGDVRELRRRPRREARRRGRPPSIRPAASRCAARRGVRRAHR